MAAGLAFYQLRCILLTCIDIYQLAFHLLALADIGSECLSLYLLYYRRHLQTINIVLCCFPVVIPYPAPLPTFSSMLRDVLASDAIHKDIHWRQFVLESSFFYFDLLPLAEGPARISYVNIGRSMYEKYPSISAKGSTPWVCICIYIIIIDKSV